MSNAMELDGYGVLELDGDELAIAGGVEGWNSEN